MGLVILVLLTTTQQILVVILVTFFGAIFLFGLTGSFEIGVC